ncbi:hypothetical protein [Heyndrickxia coagulans]|uniref:hypothetical protein n=1 Tax=Heyndrickxia coagulans TaxID=1398 RepID=UPI0011D27F6A|nr:hypothetical protein [Heyndrickxia coagulans]
MKDKTQAWQSAIVFHRGNERQNTSPGKAELSFIRVMKDKTQAWQSQIVLHQGDEGQNPGLAKPNCPSSG